MTDNPRFVYIVTGGDYSNYTIFAVFDKKKLAQQFINSKCNSKYYRVEEYTLNKELVLQYYSVRYHPNKPESEQWTVSDYDIYDDSDIEFIDNKLNQVVLEVGYIDFHYLVFIKSKNRETALKSATELIMQFVAKNGGKLCQT